MPAPPLRDLQASFWRALTDPGSAAGILPAIEEGPTLSARDRFAVYAGMYRARLVEALEDDFPHVAAVLGDRRFGELARAYVAANPSSHPSLRHLGRAFPAFVAAAPIPGLPPFLADLARLEWARVEVFDAADRPPVSLEHLRAVPVDGWPELRFALVPAVRLLSLGWPVHRRWSEGAEEAALEPQRVGLRVWREGFVVYQAAMAPAEERALGRLGAGEPFGSVCEAFDGPEEAAGLLLRWVADGLLASA